MIAFLLMEGFHGIRRNLSWEKTLISMLMVVQHIYGTLEMAVIILKPDDSLTPVIHSYSSQGTYTISVTIRNSCGDSSVYTKQITIGTNGIKRKLKAKYFIYNLSQPC